MDADTLNANQTGDDLIKAQYVLIVRAFLATDAANNFKNKLGQCPDFTAPHYTCILYLIACI